MNNFLKRVDEGYYEEVELSEYILANVASDKDVEFMGKYRIDISMILNGRINENKIPGSELQVIIDSWNERMGFKVIATAY